MCSARHGDSASGCSEQHWRRGTSSPHPPINDLQGPSLFLLRVSFSIRDRYKLGGENALFARRALQLLDRIHNVRRFLRSFRQHAGCLPGDNYLSVSPPAYRLTQPARPALTPSLLGRLLQLPFLFDCLSCVLYRLEDDSRLGGKYKLRKHSFLTFVKFPHNTYHPRETPDSC